MRRRNKNTGACVSGEAERGEKVIHKYQPAALFHKYAKWIAAALCLVLFGIIAADLLANQLDDLDAAGYRFVSLFRCAPVTAFLRCFTNLAHPAALILISLLLVIFMKKKAYRLAVYVNMVLGVLLNLALKACFLRGRPADVAHLVNETGYSFPSGHAMAATAFYGFMAFLLWQSGASRRKKWLGTVGLGLTVLIICMSRVYLGAHYTSDVLAGWAVSTAYLIVFASVVKRYLTEGEREPMERNTGKRNEGLFASFLHAFDGIRESLRTERNLLIHFSVMALVILFGALLKISAVEWLVCIVFFGMVIGAELLNTAVEATVDICAPEENPKARLAKDAAAGAVLITAIMSAVAGCIIFLPKLWALLEQAMK